MVAIAQWRVGKFPRINLWLARYPLFRPPCLGLGTRSEKATDKRLQACLPAFSHALGVSAARTLG
jgi:hypothetical protein